MQFMMFVVHDPAAEPYDPAQDNIGAWVADLAACGARIAGDRLRPPSHAKTVRVRAGKTLVSDGPFAESKSLLRVSPWPAPGAVCAQTKEERGSGRPSTTER